KTEARWNIGGNILDAVDREIDFFVEEGFFELLDEDAFAADLREGRLGELVASGFDDDDFGVGAGGLKYFLANEFSLPLGEHAAAGADSNGADGLHWRFLSGRNSSRMASTC